MMHTMRARPGLPRLLSAILAAFAGAPSTEAATWDKLMTQGKLAADLGDPRGAEQAFADLAAETQAPERLRAEALVRLGAVQRASSRPQVSGATFRRAMQSPGRDAQVTRLLTLALAGVAPDRKRWASQWSKVRLVSTAGVTDTGPSIAWPGPRPQGVREAFPVTDRVTFDLEDVSLIVFLHHLLTPWRPGDQWPGPRMSPGFEAWPQSYQPPAVVEGLEFVIHAGVGGFADMGAGPRITVKASSMPWNELFENVLASNGLGFVVDGNLLFIARVEDLGAIEHIRRRTYGGPPISLNFLYGELGDVLGLFKDITGLGIVPDANLQGSVTMKISERPAMWVFDLVLVTNDLAATRSDAPAGAQGARALRIQKLTDVKGEAIDPSRLMIDPPTTPSAPSSSVVSPGSAPTATFAHFEGAVQLKKAGGREWISARSDMPLAPGDLVRTGCAASAEIKFMNGTRLHVRSDSLIAIESDPKPGVVSVASSPSSGAADSSCGAPLPPAR